jgi:hypothetical protein
LRKKNNKGKKSKTAAKIESKKDFDLAGGE